MAVSERHFCGMESETSTAPRIVSVSQPSWNMTEPLNTFTLQQHTRTQSYKSTQSKSGQYFSPLKLWQRFPAVKSLLVHRAPPSWSLFNDAPRSALWDWGVAQANGYVLTRILPYWIALQSSTQPRLIKYTTILVRTVGFSFWTKSVKTIDVSYNTRAKLYLFKYIHVGYIIYI